MPLGWNPPLPHRKPRSVANSCTRRFLRWQPPTLFHLCQNHAFIDGNKRVGANAAITFLLMNDWEPAFDEDALVKLVLSVASGVVAKPDLIRFFESGCRPSSSY
jgi:prophage maintenance system killer protein